MLVQTIPIRHPLTITAQPLTPSSFAPFGAVLTNPAPDKLPHATTSASDLPPNVGATIANQGTAIQYRSLAPPLQNLYPQAPSAQPSSPRTTMFVCGARALLPPPPPSTSTPSQGKETDDTHGLFQLKILERHPFTTQTFIPLGASRDTRYLVIVAPTLPSPAASSSSSDIEKQLPVPGDAHLPGRGMPDLDGLRAFVATGAQAVTYGAGTWHAPMAALGRVGVEAVDFLVVQFANDVAVEDCQEVALEGEKKGEEAMRILVKVPGMSKLSRL